MPTYLVNTPIYNSLNVLVPEGEKPEWMKFTGDIEGSVIYQTLLGSTPLIKDNVDTGFLYYEGNPLTGQVPIQVSTDDVIITNSNQKIISNLESIGIVRWNNLMNAYIWDEQYVTPCGLFDATTSNPSGTYDLTFPAENQIRLRFSSVSIIPKEGNTLVLQRYHLGYTNNLVNSDTLGIDDINNVELYQNGDLFLFNITNVTTAGSDYLITVDKPFTDDLTALNAFITTESPQYSLILLNRNNQALINDIQNKTWKQIEIHQFQLLGDPYENTSDLNKPFGKKNYLEYNGSNYLGLLTLLRDLPGVDYLSVDNPLYSKTPMIVLKYEQPLNDRIDDTVLGDVKVILPNVMLQGQSNIVTLSNLLPILQSNIGKYSALSFNDVIYGYVFYDLRLIVLTDSELVAALAYNSNRNYTLPSLLVSGNNLNKLPATDPNYNESGYQYFATYRLKTPHYSKTLPCSKLSLFNFDTNSKVFLTLPSLTHLNEMGVNDIGFEANDYEIIIGEFEFDFNTKKITGFKNLGIMPAEPLLSGGSQINHSTKSYKLNDTIPGAEAPYLTSSIPTVPYSLLSDPVNANDYYGLFTDSIIQTGLNNWFLGLVEYKKNIVQYRATFSINLPAEKWNTSVNPTFEAGNPLMPAKLISEIALYEVDENGVVDVKPSIYGKIMPPIQKTNQSDLALEIDLDF